MLTRLKVTGFKNLVDTELRFGPFTCIAGYNGVGKSNIFDAIRFLSLLADHTFPDAASRVRGGADPARLFTAGGDGRMIFDCDVLIPASGRDDFHQPSEATHTFLKYVLELALVPDERGLARIELRREDLGYVTQGEAKQRLGFHFEPDWFSSVFRKSPRRATYIETLENEAPTRVRLSADKMRDDAKSKRGGGKPTDFYAATLPRTVLSAAQNADESRTAVLLRAEMRSWRILQLEPSQLREPDELQAPSSLTTEGRHLPSTLFRLTSQANGHGDRTLADISNRLAQLVDGVSEVRVVRDDVRRVLQLVLTDIRGDEFSASSLSDGTLRFIALSVLERDATATGVLCLEEPENGIHPERMRVMMQLLQEMATHTSEPISETNPLRQVIVSTHSPVVVAHTDRNDLVFVDHRDPPNAEPGRYRAMAARPCERTWRDRLQGKEIAALTKGDILRYLGALRPEDADDGATDTTYGSVAHQLDLFGPSR